MTDQIVDLSIKVDQDDFDLLKNNVDFGKSREILELLTDEVVSSVENLNSYVKEYVKAQPENLAPLYYELTFSYIEDLNLPRRHLVDAITSILNEDAKLKNSRVGDFLTLCNSFPPSSVRSLIQDCKVLTTHLVTNLGTALLTRLNVFTPQQYRQSLEKNSVQYENYQLNLEDSLGYALLATQLSQAASDPRVELKIDFYTDMVVRTIGFYKLDSYRAFDVVFEVLVYYLVKNPSLPILFLKKSPWWPREEEHIYSSDLEEGLENIGKGGNRKALQLIAMRLHQRTIKAVPETEKLLIAILIKGGFINLGQLFEALKPLSDKEMEAIEADLVNKQKKEELEASELAMAAPLDDSDDESSSKGKDRKSVSNVKNGDAAKQEAVVIDPNQNHKLTILKACLTLGLYPESVFILTQYPFFIKYDENLVFLANRLVDAVIDPLYRSTIPFSSGQFSGLSAAKSIVTSSRTPSLNDTVTLKPFAETEVAAFDPSMHSYASKKFVFFAEWKDSLPKVETMEDLFQFSNEFLPLLGSKIAAFPSTFEKLCKVVQQFDDKEQKFEYFRKFLFPYMSFITNNPAIIQDCYNFLKQYDLETRYNLYGEFYQSMYIKNQSEIQLSYKKIEKETGNSLKRLTLQTSKTLSRKLAKLAASSPMIVLSRVIESLESYDNLTDLIVENFAPLLNDYAWDVLPIAILIRLTKSGRSAVQEDGLNERHWLQSLSNFIGKVSRVTQMNLNPILTYCLKKLNNGELSESLVLKDLLSLMTGIQSSSNLTMEQIELLNSGKSLRKIAFDLLQDKRLQSVKPATRLLNELFQSNSFNEFFILLSSLTSDYITCTETDHLKVLAQKNDEFESILHLFCELVNEFSKYDEFIKNVLPVDQLSTEYGVAPQWSFEIWRKRLSQMIDRNELEQEGIWHPVLAPIMESVQASFPHYSWSDLNIGFFVTFWQLSLFDINFDEEFYGHRQTALQAHIKALKTKLKVSRKDRDVTNAQLKKIEEDIEASSAILQNIPKDKSSHSEHAQNVITRMNREKSYWTFNGVELNTQIEKILDHCILPRAVHSPFDSVFAAKFIFKWHKMNTKDEGLLLKLLEFLMNKDILNSLLLTFTSKQAENFGLFYSEILRQLNSWRDEEVFIKEAIGTYEETPLVGMAQTDFKSFQRGLFLIHQNLLFNIELSLEDTSYMTRSNSLVFLKNLLGVFPLVSSHCESLIEAVGKVIAEDDRQDLKLASNSLVGRVKSYSSTWVKANKFYEMNEAESQEFQEMEAISEKKKQLEEKKRLASIAVADEERRKKEALKRATRDAEIAAAQATKEAEAKAKETENGNPYAKLRTAVPAGPKVSSSSSTSSAAATTKQELPAGPKSSSASATPATTKSAPLPEIPAGPKSTTNDSKRPTSSAPVSAEEKSRILRERLEAERQKSATPQPANQDRPSRGRFRDVTGEHAGSSTTSKEVSLDRKRKLSPEAESRPDKRPQQQSTAPRMPSMAKPLPPPPGNAPPLGPASAQNAPSTSGNAGGFDPKKRKRMAPVASPASRQPQSRTNSGTDNGYNGRRTGNGGGPYRDRERDRDRDRGYYNNRR